MRISYLSLILVIVFLPNPSWAQAPDGQEAICTSPAVIMCENFENRTVTTGDTQASFQWTTPKYKNPGLDGTGVANGDVVTDDRFDGSKSLKFTYPQGDTGGTYMRFPFGASANDVYVRWYTKWSPGFVWSIISNKHSIIEEDTQTPGIGFLGVWFAEHTPARADMQPWGNNGVLDPRCIGPGNSCQQNAANVGYTTGHWTCLEMHVQNNTGGQSNGTMEGWIDGVQVFNYPNITINNQPHAYNTLMLGSYWNEGAGAHPWQARWHDNIVVSRQRIGCLDNPAPQTPVDVTPPSQPSGLRLSALWDWLLSMVG